MFLYFYTNNETMTSQQNFVPLDCFYFRNS